MTIGDRISAVRKLAGMTQKELGERAGIDPSTIRKYESGRLNPKFETVKKIADALEISLAELYTEEYFLAPPTSEEDAKKRGEELQKFAQCTIDNAYAAAEHLHTVEEDVKRRDATFHALAEYYSKLLDKMNALGVQTSVLTALLIMQDEVSPASIIANIALTDDKKARLVSSAIKQLAQIPAYQLKADTAQSAPDDTADKDPTEK